MGWENLKDISLYDVEEHFVKIFKKSSFRNSEENSNDFDLDSDDSNMKIYTRE